MKKLFLLILILVSKLLAQGWNNTVPIGIPDYLKTDIFTNSAGIHILVQLNTSSNIVYYNVNSAGDIDKTVTLENSGSFPNIVGTNDKIYAIYKTGNNIRVRYSTDNGSSWLTDIADRPTSANYCNGVDAVYEPNYGVHIVWATLDGGAYGYETYYRRLAPDNSWPEYKNVTDDGAAQYGGNPTVVVSPNRVHVSFNTDATNTNYGTGNVKTRDKYLGSWQTPQPVVPVSGPDEQSVDERLMVRGDFLYLFYNCDVTPNALRFRKRSLSTNAWSDYTTLDAGPINTQKIAFEIIKTSNDNIHILCKKHIGAPIGWAYTYKYSTDGGTNWFTISNFDSGVDNLREIGLSSISNDLFCTWVKSGAGYFRQYDAAPLAPQNLAVSINSSDESVLTWSPNNEPDVRIANGKYKIYRAETDMNGNILPYQLAATINAINGSTAVTSWIDTEAMDSYVRKLYYKITAIDINQYESLFSNVVWRFGRLGKITSQNNSNLGDALSDNYPNPFNPSTVINYAVKEAGLVRLKVYDILGAEVAELVNETKEAGYHSTEFNASQLPSGVYIYTLQVNGFTSSKKMLLMK
jgi:hypothetical protein